MNYCLPPHLANQFRRALGNGTIDPYQMSQMSSEQRRALLETVVGKENAKDVNALFEQKLLNKNIQQGLMTWARNIAGMSPQAKRDLVTRVSKMDNILKGQNQQTFLNDLAEQKLGVGVSHTEAQQIADMSDNIINKRADMDTAIPNKDAWSLNKETDAQYNARLEYGRAVVELQNFVKDAKTQANKTTLQDLKSPKGIAQFVGKGVLNAPGIEKSIRATLDDSAIFRQGWKTVFTNPVIWKRNAVDSFRNIWNTLKGEKVMDEVNAEIISRPTYDQMQKAKLAIGNMEEEFPSSLPEKVLRRVYRASENAYTAFLHKTRADIFDKYLEIVKEQGLELGKQDLENIGRLVNSLTGRGHLGAKLEKGADVVNTVFFSPRYFKSHIDTLTQPLTGGATMAELAQGDNGGTNFVRKQAALNLAKYAIGSTMSLAIANIVAQSFGYRDTIDLDPRSADFGKLKIGNTRFDFTGGMGSLITLGARLISGSTKSSVSEKITKISDPNNHNPYAPTYGSILKDFFKNKLSPIARIGTDFFTDETDSKIEDAIRSATNQPPSSGKFSWKGEAINSVTPLPVSNAFEAWREPNSAPFLLNLLADGLGVSANTYGGSKDISRQLDIAIAEGNKTEEARLRKELDKATKMEAAKAGEKKVAEREQKQR